MTNDLNTRRASVTQTQAPTAQTPAAPAGALGGHVINAGSALPTLTGPLANNALEIANAATLVARAGAVREVAVTQLDFSKAMMVLPRTDHVKALRFGVPFPVFTGARPLVFPDFWPKDMKNADGTRHKDAGLPHPKAGKPLEDHRGNVIKGPDGGVPHGIVVFNTKENIFQGLQATGQSTLLFNGLDDEAIRQLKAKVDLMGGPAGMNTAKKIQKLVDAGNAMGLHCYPSDQAYAKKALTAQKGQETGIPGYGVFTRSNELVKAGRVQGPLKVGPVNIGAAGYGYVNYGLNKETNTERIRPVDPQVMVDQHMHADGTRLAFGELPVLAIKDA